MVFSSKVFGNRCSSAILWYLSILNSHLHVPTFKMETAESNHEVDSTGGVGHLNRPNRRLFSCPNSPPVSKYLRFQTKKGVFRFWALPFRVATAPPEFTRIVKEVKLIAQARNFRIHQYLDDWLLWSPTKEQCLIDC